MRLWSLHASMLDNKGLVAAWREALGAQKALIGLEEGQKVGYQSHPQLDRFKASEDPVGYICQYLWELRREADNRGTNGYKFDDRKIAMSSARLLRPLPVTEGQVDFEMDWLRSKVELRAPEQLWRLEEDEGVMVMDTFVIVPGDKEPWERG